jgi:hypothetical protein
MKSAPLIIPNIQIIGVTDRAAFNTFRASEKIVRDSYDSFKKQHEKELKEYYKLDDELVKNKTLDKIPTAINDKYNKLSKKVSVEIVPKLLKAMEANWDSIDDSDKQDINNLSKDLNNNPTPELRTRMLDKLYSLSQKYPAWLKLKERNTFTELIELKGLFSKTGDLSESEAFDKNNKMLVIAQKSTGILTKTESNNVKKLIALENKYKNILLGLMERSKSLEQSLGQKALEDRDSKMVENLVTQMKNNHHTNAVLIIGAAHNPGIVGFLNNYKVTYALVSIPGMCEKWKNDVECLKYKNDSKEEESFKILDEKLDKGENYQSSFSTWLQAKTKPLSYLDKPWQVKEIEVFSGVKYIDNALAEGLTASQVETGLKDNFGYSQVGNGFFERFARYGKNLYLKIKGKNGILLKSDPAINNARFAGLNRLAKNLVVIPEKNNTLAYEIDTSTTGAYITFADNVRNAPKNLNDIAKEITMRPGLPIFIDEEYANLLPIDYMTQLDQILKNTYQDSGRIILEVKDKKVIDNLDSTKMAAILSNRRYIKLSKDINRDNPDNYFITITKKQNGSVYIDANGLDQPINGLNSAIIEKMKTGGNKPVSIFYDGFQSEDEIYLIKRDIVNGLEKQGIEMQHLDASGDSIEAVTLLYKRGVRFDLKNIIKVSKAESANNKGSFRHFATVPFTISNIKKGGSIYIEAISVPIRERVIGFLRNIPNGRLVDLMAAISKGAAKDHIKFEKDFNMKVIGEAGSIKVSFLLEKLLGDMYADYDYCPYCIM